MNYGNATIEQLSSGRTEIWIRTLSAMWQHNPLFGLGANGYIHISPHVWPNSVHPHSGPVQLFTELGIIGFTALVLCILTTLKIWSKNPSTKLQLIARIALMGISIASLVDGHFFHNFSLMYIAILIALSFSFNNSGVLAARSNLASAVGTLIISLSLLVPIKLHWQSFLLQQAPLTDQEQFNAVSEFPSHYSPSIWLTDWNIEPELLTQAIKLGQKIGPNQCKFYQQESSTLNKQDIPKSLLIKTKLACEIKKMETLN